MGSAAGWTAGRACLVAAVALARDRRRALLAIGLGTVAVMLALRIGLLAARHATLGNVPPEALGPVAVGHLFDRVTGQLRDVLRALVLLSGVVVAAVVAAILAWPIVGTRTRS